MLDQYPHNAGEEGAQNSDKLESSGRDWEEDGSWVSKFPEPRAWALKWEPPGHFTQPLEGQRLDEEVESTTDGNGKWSVPSVASAGFPQPKGWALKWDGESISALQEFYNRSVPNSTGRNADLD